MDMYHVGDELVLRIEEDFGYTDKTFRDVKVQVIGVGIDQDVCYVPHYLNVPGSFRLGANHMKWFGFHKKFLNEMGLLILPDTKIVRVIKAIQGEPCERCQEFIIGAVKSLDEPVRCRACRENPYR